MRPITRVTFRRHDRSVTVELRDDVGNIYTAPLCGDIAYEGVERPDYVTVYETNSEGRLPPREQASVYELLLLALARRHNGLFLTRAEIMGVPDVAALEIATTEHGVNVYAHGGGGPVRQTTVEQRQQALRRIAM